MEAFSSQRMKKRLYEFSLFSSYLKSKKLCLTILSIFTGLFIIFILFGAYVDYTDNADFFKKCTTLQLGHELPFNSTYENILHEEIIEVSKRLLGKEFSGAFGHNRNTGKRYGAATHSNAFGCMNAKFTVDLDTELSSQGIFKDGKEYDVLLKFSQDSSESGSWKPKMLSAALKFYGVNAITSWSRVTQDFIFQASYGYPTHPKHFLEIFKQQVVNEDKNAQWKWLLKHPFVFFNVQYAKLRGSWHTVFDEDLYNTVIAYRWGETGAKFYLEPCDPASLLSTDFNKNIRYDILKQLAHTDICFNMFVRLQADSCHEPIDLISKFWTRTNLKKVGQLIIPKNNVLFQQDKCQNFHFNICNGIEEHKPIGAISRARCRVYESVSEWRIEQNLELQKVIDVEDEPRAMCFRS